MVLYLPGVVALLFKVFLLTYCGKIFLKSRSPKVLFSLLIVLTACNVLELLGYNHLDDPEAVFLFLRIYYVSLAMLLVFLFQLTVLAVFEKVSKGVEVLNFILGAAICAMMLFSDLILAGASAIGYSITRVPGKYYWVAQSYALIMLGSSISVLVTGYMRTNDPFVKIQSLYLLLAVGSLALPMGVIIVLMTLGVEISAVFILPIGITFFLAFVTIAIKNVELFDIRIWIPFSTRYRLFKALRAEFMIYKDGTVMPARERKKNHEKVYLQQALLDYEGTLNQREIAEKMGISESSLSKKRKEYGI